MGRFHHTGEKLSTWLVRPGEEIRTGICGKFQYTFYWWVFDPVKAFPS